MGEDEHSRRFSAGRLLRSVLPAALLCLCASGCGTREPPSPRISLAETRRIENLAAGKFLVASPDISDADLLNKQLGAGVTSENLRIYLGYTGWAAGQLEREIEAGEWLIFPGETRLVFDPHPETLWSRLIGRLEQQLANYSTPALFYTQCSDFHFIRSNRS